MSLLERTTVLPSLAEVDEEDLDSPIEFVVSEKTDYDSSASSSLELPRILVSPEGNPPPTLPLRRKESHVDLRPRCDCAKLLFEPRDEDPTLADFAESLWTCTCPKSLGSAAAHLLGNSHASPQCASVEPALVTELSYLSHSQTSTSAPFNGYSSAFTASPEVQAGDTPLDLPDQVSYLRHRLDEALEDISNLNTQLQLAQELLKEAVEDADSQTRLLTQQVEYLKEVRFILMHNMFAVC